jgi:nitrate reductase NapAB chaperone NapD
MKIKFEDSSFIEVHKSDNKIIVIIQAKDYSNPLKKICNTVELTKEEFQQLISDI